MRNNHSKQKETLGGEHLAAYADYKEHYRLDAQFIMDPQDLPPGQRESEERRLEAIVRLLDLRPGCRVLDVGCGSGWLSEKLAQRGTSTFASDLAPEGVSEAKARSGGDVVFIAGDVYCLPFSPRSFDGAVLSEVAEHLEDLDRALEEVYNLLKEGGRFVISVPNNEKIRWHLCIHCNRPTPANAHLRSFNESGLVDYLERHRLAVVKVVKLSNKLLELIRFSRWTRWFPYVLWRAIDSLFNIILRKSAFLCAVAVKEPIRKNAR